MSQEKSKSNWDDIGSKLLSENQVLQKLIYRNRNQHRRTKIFAALKKVLRKSHSKFNFVCHSWVYFNIWHVSILDLNLFGTDQQPDSES